MPFVKQKILKFLSYVLVAVAASFLTLYLSAPEYSKLEQLEDLILTRFIGEAEAEELEDAAADAMVSATKDRWSYYIPASEMESYMEQMENAYVGVGITIQQEEETGYRIMEVTKGGPAEEAGLKPGDLLVKAGDTDLRELDVNEVRSLVKGAEGTFVSLTVLRQEEELTFSVERRTVMTIVAEGEMLPGNVGLVTIKNFDSRCAEETIAVMEDLIAQGAEKLIFDVRNNPGGYAEELIQVLDYLLPEGEVFHTLDYTGKEHIDYSDEKHLDLPMAVLVNSESYSAAEFFAAALKEYEAAVIVGEQTCGKGYFQTTIHLNDGSAVALSIGKYFTPKGENLQDVGLIPDKVVDVDDDTFWEIYYGNLPKEADPQVQAALELLK